jgi:hypothetical protein
VSQPQPKKASREDAMLFLQLHRDFPMESSQWVQSNVMPKSYEEFETSYPRGSTGRLHVTRLLGFYEMAGTLAYYRALSEDLFFDSGFQFWFNWEKLEPIVLDWQKAIKDPFAWDTTVWFANRMKRWWRKNTKLKASKKRKRYQWSNRAKTSAAGVSGP